VFPESLIIAIDVFPECLHEAQGISSAGVSKDASDVGVSTRRVAVFAEGSVTVVRPETVDCPAI